MKIEFEDGLINFKILLKAGKVLEFLIFESKLFRSMAVDGKKGGILLLVLALHASLMVGSILKKYSGD